MINRRLAPLALLLPFFAWRRAASAQTALDGQVAVKPPSTTRLGGVKAHTAVSQQFLTGIATNGSVSGAQPAFTDISGTATLGQLPNSTGAAFDASTATSSWRPPAGTIAQRPGSPVAGMERYNSDLGAREAYSAASTTWRAFGGSYVLKQSGAAVPTSSSVEVNLVAIKVPGGMVGANGTVRITTIWSYTNSSNTKTAIIRASTSSGDTSGGTTFKSVSLTTSVWWRNVCTIRNTNSTGAQTGEALGSAAADFTTFATAPPTASIDTASDWYVNINGKVAGGETFTLFGYTVEVMPW